MAEEELESLKQLHKAVQRELEATVQNLEETEKDRKNLRTKNKDLSDRVDSLSEELSITQEDYRQLHEQLQAEEGETDRLEKEAEEVQEELQRERRARVEADTAAKRDKAECDRLTLLLQKWEREAMMKSLTDEDNQGESGAGGGNETPGHDAVGRLQSALDSTASELDALRLEYKNLQEKYSRLDREHRALEQSPVRGTPFSSPLAQQFDEPSGGAGGGGGADESVMKALREQASKLSAQLREAKAKEEEMDKELDSAHQFGEEVHKRLQSSVEMLKGERETSRRLAAELEEARGKGGSKAMPPARGSNAGSSGWGSSRGSVTTGSSLDSAAAAAVATGAAGGGGGGFARSIVRPSKTQKSAVQTVASAMEKIASVKLAEKWDNVGVLVDSLGVNDSTPKVLMCNDLTENVTDEAFRSGTNVIFTYHPIIFSGLKKLSLDNSQHRTILNCIAQGIGIYSPHTSLDAARDGVNDWLAHGMGRTTHVEPITEVEGMPGVGSGRIATLASPTDMKSLCTKLKAHLGVKSLRIAVPDNVSERLGTVAICAGSGREVLAGVKADVYLTGEMPHHDVLAAVARGVAVILCEHSSSERGFLKAFASRLEKSLPSGAKVSVSAEDVEPLSVV